MSDSVCTRCCCTQEIRHHAALAFCYSRTETRIKREFPYKTDLLDEAFVFRGEERSAQLFLALRGCWSIILKKIRLSGGLKSEWEIWLQRYSNNLELAQFSVGLTRQVNYKLFGLWSCCKRQWKSGDWDLQISHLCRRKSDCRRLCDEA